MAVSVSCLSVSRTRVAMSTISGQVARLVISTRPRPLRLYCAAFSLACSIHVSITGALTCRVLRWSHSPRLSGMTRFCTTSRVMSGLFSHDAGGSWFFSDGEPIAFASQLVDGWWPFLCWTHPSQSMVAACRHLVLSSFSTRLASLSAARLASLSADGSGLEGGAGSGLSPTIGCSAAARSEAALLLGGGSPGSLLGSVMPVTNRT